MMRDNLTTLAELVGAALIVAGASLVAVWVGLVVAGAAFIAAGYLLGEGTE